MESPLCIGVIGALPTAAPPLIRVGAVSAMRRLGLDPEQSPATKHPAVHVAVHALMNGIPRTVLAVAGNDRLVALTRLLASETPAVVVVPGPLSLDEIRALAEVFVASDAGCLWLDAPPGDASDTVQLRRRIQVPSHRLRFALPAVRGLTPGRPGSELLPASALIPPLHLGTTQTLKGSFEPPAPVPGLDELKRAGCGVLAAHGYQRRLGLAYPLSRPKRESVPTVDDLATRIRRALREATDSHFDGRPDSVGFRAGLERSARVVLAEFQRTGEIAEFRVAVTGGDNGPLVDVAYRTPKRITDVTIRLTSAE